MITVHKLAKAFNGRSIVKDVSFEAPNGQIIGLLGANGAGKTTSLRMICGALKPDSGSVDVDDCEGPGNPLLRQRRIGALLDHMGIYSRLTVRENLEYYGRLHGMSADALAERVADVIKTLGLETIANRRTAGFSQGERMKTALGRALLHSPNNLLLDEPTNGLDIPTIRSLRDLLKRLRDAGICVVFSSHVLDEVRALCDRVVIIAGGTIVAQGSPAELCASTQTTSLEEAFIQLTCPTEVR